MREGVRDKGEERRGGGVLGGGKNDLLLHHIPSKPNIQTDARWRKKKIIWIFQFSEIYLMSWFPPLTAGLLNTS